ncbi:MAG: hypothetical protein AABY75_05740 [Bacteroidota bacterium]
MTTGTKKPSKYRGQLLSFTESERLRAEQADDQRYLEAARGRTRVSDEDNPDASLPPGQPGGVVDPGAIEARIRRRGAALEKLDPHFHKLVGVQRQRACTKMKEHEEYFSKNMLSTFDMGAYPKGDSHERHQNYLKAVEKSVSQEVGNLEFQRRAREYKDLARRLDPDDPDLTNLERFRPKRRY